jgi:hypothetical protein
MLFNTQMHLLGDGSFVPTGSSMNSEWFLQLASLRSQLLRRVVKPMVAAWGVLSTCVRQTP